jgi:hypothetical protein
VALTDAARERAEELGITLIVPGNTPAQRAAATARPATAAQSATTEGAALPAKPRGCQHGPQGSAPAKASSPAAAQTAVVEQLVDAVSALKKSGR